jgi:DNA-binding response OmpR family regulator
VAWWRAPCVTVVNPPYSGRLDPRASALYALLFLPGKEIFSMSKNVLVVDDDPAFLSELSGQLKTAGYSVIAAKDGSEAIFALGRDQVKIDAAIIDLALPEIGGFQLIGELTRVQKRMIPVIAITGAYSDVYLEVAEYLGAKVAIRKPFAGQPLAPIVEALGRTIAEDRTLGLN